MNILVTGCAGFIGSSLCETLVNTGHKVIGVDNFDPFYDRKIKDDNIKQLVTDPNFRLYEFDITDKSKFGQIDESVDVIIHLAAKAGVRPSIEDPPGYIKTNIEGTQQILDYAVIRGIDKIIFASSSSVYGNNLEIPFSETHSVDRPISPYAFTKKACELLLHNYYYLYNISSISLRFFTVYGPRQRPDLAIHKFFKAIYSGSPISLYGDGHTYRDYTYISDIIKGVMASVELIKGKKPVYEIVNLGNNKPVSLIELIAEIEAIVGKKALLEYKPVQPGDATRTFADITKATNLLGYTPSTSLKEGLAFFNEWIQKTKEYR